LTAVLGALAVEPGIGEFSAAEQLDHEEFITRFGLVIPRDSC
jgi:hypothetical protein